MIEIVSTVAMAKIRAASDAILTFDHRHQTIDRPTMITVAQLKQLNAADFPPPR